jgi:hypothetical protein
MTLVADLKLRFGAARIPVRVYLPSPVTVEPGRTPLVLWLSGSEHGEWLGRELGEAATAVVLELGNGRGYDAAALDWAAEHAREFGADAGRLVVAGNRAGAARAAHVACDARDSGWPELHRQLLVHPAFGTPLPVRPLLDGVAPATIVTTGAATDEGRRYASALRGAGVEVHELVSGARRPMPVRELARSVR